MSAQEEELSKFLVELEIKNYQQRFSSVTQECFDRCVNKFNSQSISMDERKCIEICADKYANSWDRCVKRFQEFISIQQQSLQGR